MRYLFEVRSAEQNDFSMSIQIDAKATFLELHDCIVKACKYDTSQMASFFTVNAEGQRLQEIGLMELSSEGAEINVAVMDVATLGEFIGNDVKKLEYEYDFFGDRYFTLILEEIQDGDQEKAVVVQQRGTPPNQISLDGFEGIDFSTDSIGRENMDYEKYLDSFDDCREEDSEEEQFLDDFDENEFN